DAASAVGFASPGLRRFLPPRLPRRRRGRAGLSVVATSPPDGGAGSGSGASGGAASAPALSSDSSFLRLKNARGKRILLVVRARESLREPVRRLALRDVEKLGQVPLRLSVAATPNAPAAAVRPRSYHRAHQATWGGRDGRGEGGVRAAPDRGSGRLVRIPGGDAEPDGGAVRG